MRRRKNVQYLILHPGPEILDRSVLAFLYKSAIWSKTVAPPRSNLPLIPSALALVQKNSNEILAKVRIWARKFKRPYSTCMNLRVVAVGGPNDLPRIMVFRDVSHYQDCAKSSIVGVTLSE